MIRTRRRIPAPGTRKTVMLLELYGQNFGCFRDEFRLSMLATDVDPGADRGIVKIKLEDDGEPLRLLRAVAIYGPNGSGKSTVIRAARGLRHLISETRRRHFRSDSLLRPYEPFALAAHGLNPVRLGIKAFIEGRVYDYELQFGRAKLLSERLHWLKANGDTVLFRREGQEVSGEWTKDERFTLLAKDFRPNALLLSLADRLTPALAKNIAVGIRRLLTSFDTPVQDLAPPWFSTDSSVARRARDDSEFSAWLLSQLKSADVGVVELRTRGENVHVASLFGETEVEKFVRLFLLHQGESGLFPIPYAYESHGTRKLIELAPMLFELAHGARPHAVFIDEIDESLHPVLLQGIIRHFNCDIPMDKVRGQLIFVTHDTSLIDAEAKNALLRRDQIYLTEKDASGAARLYSVAEFRERNNLNLRRRYLQGRYGALPSLGTFGE